MVPSRFLAGTPHGPDGKAAPNITPDPETGIGTWSEDDLIALLKDGQTPEFDFVGGAMAEIVKNTTRLTDADRRAIAVYLRTLPAVRSETRPAK
jgi:mono/diheme cytochrome c family protein